MTGETACRGLLSCPSGMAPTAPDRSRTEPVMCLDKPRVAVDFDERVAEDLVLLCSSDTRTAPDGSTLQLEAGVVDDLHMADAGERGRRAPRRR